MNYSVSASIFLSFIFGRQHSNLERSSALRSIDC